jgi:putative methanogenesis marker protein 15
LAKASLSPEKIDAIGVTGYGRTILGEKLKANLIQDEITVCAKGATFLAKKTEGYTTIVDIGGGDNKAVTTYDGVPDSFTVGGVCAGASGRFLEVAANRLGVNIEKFGELAIQGDPSKVPMNAYCIVFGMQDIVTSMAEGAHKEDVAAAACHSVAEQFFEQQMQDIEVREPIIQVGTTSLNIGLVRAMESVTKRKILVPKYSPYAGAIGAALLASGVKFFE